MPTTGQNPTMGDTLELSKELKERIDQHRRDDESYEEFIEELLDHYEAEGHTLWEGYGGPP